jgi:hypothetical protein
MRRYPGPLAFSTEQESLFFGRDNDIKELTELIFVERKVLLYSKSGYGKSSLLNAGVEPKLKNNNFEFIKIRFYDGSNSTITPNDRFLATVRQNADFVNTEDHRTIIDIYAKDYLNEYWSVFKKNQMAGNDKKTYVLIFDQFEELFSFPDEQIDEFKNRLAEILPVNRPPRFLANFERDIFRDESSVDKDQVDQLYHPVNIKVVFSIRSDRLSELNRLADKIHDIQKVFYELKPLSYEQIRKAIEIPAMKPGQYDSIPFTFSPKAVDKIITALTLEGKKTVSTTSLQIICQRIEGDFIPKEDGKKDFILKNNTDNIIEAEELPDFKDIFLDFYNQSVAEVKTDTPEKVRKFIEDELIKEGRRIQVDQLLCRNVCEETLKALVDSKLINVERNSVDSFSYELSHDTLIPPIREMAEKRRKLEEIERLEAERQEELRIAKEKADNERIEHEKARIRQRKYITIISSALVICFFFALYGYRQKRIAVQAQINAVNAQMKELQRADSLQTTLEELNEANSKTEKALEAFQQEQKLRQSQVINGLLRDVDIYLVNGKNQYAIETLWDAWKLDSTDQRVRSKMNELNLKPN